MKRKAFLNGEYLPVLLGRERTHIYIYIGKTHEIRFRLSFKASLYIFGALDRIGSESKFILDYSGRRKGEIFNLTLMTFSRIYTRRNNANTGCRFRS